MSRTKRNRLRERRRTRNALQQDKAIARPRKPRHKNMLEVSYSSAYLEEMIYNLKKAKTQGLTGRTQKTDARDTRANPSHIYSQYIHRATADYGYRYYIVNKGLSVTSRIFPNMQTCHAACLDVIENGKEIHV